MRLEDFTSSRPVIRLGLFLARVLPPRAGYGLAGAAAALIARGRPQLVATVQNNLRHVLGEEVDPAVLDEMTRRLFFHAGLTTYDFFHAVGRSPAYIADILPFPAEALARIAAARAAGRGVLFLGMHLSNFDLALLSLGSHGLPIQALSLANPRPGFRILNELREKAGFEITPISPESLRTAIHRLKSGGIVLTGADRPAPDDQVLVPFFGREAYLPLGPARLARLTGAAVFFGACHHEAGAGYTLDVLGPLEMVHTADRRADIYHNTRQFAALMETWVRAYPEQWLMFHPFWPPAGEG